MREYRLAIADYDTEILLDPEHAEAFYYRGLCYYHEDKFPLAVASLKEAVRLDSSNMDYALSLAKADAAAADFPEGRHG